MINKEVTHYIYPKRKDSPSSFSKKDDVKVDEKKEELSKVEEEPIRIRKHSFSHSDKDNKTKKKRNDASSYNKKQLWNIFDSEMDTKEEDKVECVYSTPKEDNLCHVCNSYLMIMDDGFPTCTNSKCGIIYKDILDYSPEWRYYGADDKNANDPTRCGNPINPLLVQSSFGCKVLCNTKSTYEMKKIR